jgi:hypothetical protein
MRASVRPERRASTLVLRGGEWLGPPAAVVALLALVVGRRRTTGA